MFEKIGGLPAHPLLVHLPIVFAPLLGLLTLALLVPKWRDRLIKPLAILAVITAVSTFFAVESGEHFAKTLGVGHEIDDHQEAAEMLRNIVFALTIISLAAFFLWARFKGIAQHAIVIVIALLGLASIGAAVKTGHAGATQVWKEEYDNAVKNKAKSDATPPMSDEDHANMADSDGDAN